jgi:[acyl-carrier-protein] S-malonyltransferase
MKKTAFIFPGQASQYVGMARDLHGEIPAVVELFHKASGALGFDLADVCFSGPEEKLTRTAFTQPAVFVHSCAIDLILKENDISPGAAAGHSLGEYSALVSSGALSFETALDAIARRSESMQRDCDENPGTMAAVMGMEFEKVTAALAEVSGTVVPANYNSPGQVVIAGEVSAVDDACRILKEKGAKRAVRIPVGGAYHSPLMEKSSGIMRDHILERMEFSSFGFPVYSNVTGLAIRNGEEFKKALSKQILNPVLWYPALRNMYNDGIRRFVEIGPGRVLQGLVKKSLKEADVEIEGIDTLEQLNNFLSRKAVSA